MPFIWSCDIDVELLLFEAFRGGRGGAFSSFGKSSVVDFLLPEQFAPPRDVAPFFEDVFEEDDDVEDDVTSVAAQFVSMLEREMLVWVAKLPFMLCVVVGGGNGVCVA